MKKMSADVIGGIVCIAFGAFFFIMTAVNPQLSFAAKTSDGVPGAGFFPYILSVLIMALGTALTIKGVRNPRKYVEMTEEMSGNLKTMITMVVGMVVFLAAWKITSRYFGNTGFMVCVFLFEIFLNRLFRRSWKFTLIYSVVFTVFIYVVFCKAFSIIFNA